MDDPFVHLPSEEEAPNTPSLPIVLFSAAIGLAAGAIALYLFYEVLYLVAPLSVGLAILTMLGAIGFAATFLTGLSGLRSANLNAVFSCGLVVLLLIFFGFCVLAGALAAAVLSG